MKTFTLIVFFIATSSMLSGQPKDETNGKNYLQHPEEINANHHPLKVIHDDFPELQAGFMDISPVNRKITRNPERTGYQRSLSQSDATIFREKAIPGLRPENSRQKLRLSVQSKDFKSIQTKRTDASSKHQSLPERLKSIYELNNQASNNSNRHKSGGVTEKLDSAWTLYDDDEYPGRTYFEYDANHNCIKESRYYYGGTGQIGEVLANDYKDERYYDLNGNLTSRLVYELEFDEFTEESYWTGVSRLDQKWDNQHRVTESIYFTWNSEYRDWEYLTKYQYSYDGNGNEILYSRYSWTDYQWIGKNKYTNTYDSKGNELSYIYYIWSAETLDWVESYKDEYQYDTNGKLLLWSQFEWTGTEWNWYRKSTYSYLPNGERSSLARFDMLEGNWEWVIKGDYYYGAQGLLDSIVEQNYDTNTPAWVLSNKREWIYGSNQKDYVYTYFNWSLSNLKWSGSSRNEYRFDNKNRQIYYAYYSGYNLTESLWIGSRKWLKLYDEYDNQVLYENYVWNTSAKDWEGSGTKWQYLYDANGNYLSYESYMWNPSRNAWDGYYREEIEYATQDFYKKWTEYTWDTGSNSWVYWRKSTYTHNPDGSYATVTRFFWEGNPLEWVEKIHGTYAYDGPYVYRTDMARQNTASPYVNSEKRTWKYNASDQLVEYQIHLWDTGSEEWVAFYKSLYTYDSNGLQLTYRTYNITNAEIYAYSLSKVTSNTYTEEGKLARMEEDYLDEKDIYEWEYDPEGRVVSLIYSEDEEGVYSLEEKQTISYVSGRINTIMYYYWEAGEWKTDYKTEIEYQPNGDLMRYISYHWSGGWINDEKTERTYNGLNLCASETWSEWSTQQNSWINQYKSEFTYNEDNRLARVTEFDWEDGIWQSEYRTTIGYNSSGQPEVVTDQSYEDGLWENQSKLILYYDANGNMVMERDNFWNGTSWSDPVTVYERSIDLSMLRENLKLPSVWFQGNFEDDVDFEEIDVDDIYRSPEYELGYQTWKIKNKLVKEIIYDAESENGQYSTVHYKTTDLFYSRVFTTGKETEVLQNMWLYPNPVSSMLYLNLPEGSAGAMIEIRDVAGRIVLSSRLANESNTSGIPVNHLKAGVYIVRVEAPGVSRVEKIVKR
jgi:hypothetical protein